MSTESKSEGREGEGGGLHGEIGLQTSYRIHFCFGLIRESKTSSLQNIKKYKHNSVDALYKNNQR